MRFRARTRSWISSSFALTEDRSTGNRRGVHPTPHPPPATRASPSPPLAHAHAPTTQPPTPPALPHAAQFFAVLQRVVGAKACRRAKRHAVAQLREVAALINSGRWSTFGDVVADLEGRDISTTRPTPQELLTMTQVRVRMEQKRNGFCGPDPFWMAPAFWMTPAFQREAACGLPVAGLRLFAGVDGNYHAVFQPHETAQHETLGNTGSVSESLV